MLKKNRNALSVIRGPIPFFELGGGGSMEFAPASEKLFNIIVKLTSYCCLGCDYCYIELHQSRYGMKVMSLELIEKALFDYLSLVQNERGC